MKSTDDLVMGHVDDHKLSVRKVIPLGQLVSRVAIHLFSLIFLRTVSFLQILSITITWTSSIVWSRELKWAATGSRLLVSDVSAVAVHPFIQCLLCLTHVLAAALLALDEVDEVAGLAGGGTPHIVDLP